MHRKPLILASLLLAAFAINLDTTIVNVALPTLVRELHASTTELEWIVDAYNLVFAALVLGAGNLGDRVGRKGVLLAGLGVFGAATVAGGLGTNPGELIAARAVMGLGAALIFPATLSLLTNVFTERGERARAIGLWGATAGVGIAVGPIVGGWMLENFSWPSVFFALAPVAALGAALVIAYVPTSRDPQAPPADRAGLALSTAAMALLIYTIIEAPNHGWTAARSVGGFGLALGLLGSFVLWERRTPAPLLDVGLFRNLRFSAASGAVTITFFSLMGFIFLVTLYFQFLKGYGPLSTGVRLLPVATTVGITSVVGTRLAVRSGTKLVVAGGLVALAAGLAWTSSASTGTSYLTIAGQMVLIGAGIGLTGAPATESIMGAVPAPKAGIGSAINDATRILGATLGVAVIGSVYASVYSSRLDSALFGQLPPAATAVAHRSVGGAFETAARLDAGHQTAVATSLHYAAANAFFDGFSVACLVASGVALVGAVMAAVLIPAQPPQPGAEALGEEPRSTGFHQQRKKKMRTTVRHKVLLRGEQSDSAVSIVENMMPANAPGPPLHSHAFDEAFYVLDGELTFQLGNKQTTAKAGELVFAPRGVPHTLANLSDTSARFLLVITPAGFEREFARRAASETGVAPPQWALQPIPDVNYVGPRIGER